MPAGEEEWDSVTIVTSGVTSVENGKRGGMGRGGVSYCLGGTIGGTGAEMVVGGGGKREGVMEGGSSVFPMLRVSGVSELDTGRSATGRFFSHFIVWRWT